MHSLLDQEHIDDRDRVYFTLGSQGIDNAHQAYGTTAEEWGAEAPRVDTLLQNLSRMLNSNQQFGMDDSFQLAFVNVRGGRRGGGPKRRVLLPGYNPAKTLKGLKRAVIPIPRTKEELCCARAIVKAKASVDRHPPMASLPTGTQDSIVSSHQPASGDPRAFRTLRVRRTLLLRPDTLVVRLHHCSRGRQPRLPLPKLRAGR